MIRLFCSVALLFVLIGLQACSSGNFMVYKEGHHFYISSKGPELKRILCESGDMDNIAKDSGLSQKLQDELKNGICRSDKLREYLITTLESMTKEERTALKLAFQKYHYEINNVANC